ncbi:MAG: hypothetical protein V1746_01985 [bacterium]
MHKQKRKKTLIYKQKRTNDPDGSGWWGIHNCMKGVRNWDFDAVIGIGGKSREAKKNGIDRKITWIGIGAKQHKQKGRPLLIAFKNFIRFEKSSKKLRRIAPNLSKRMYYSKKARFIFDSFTKKQKKEVRKLLKMAKGGKSSSIRKPRHQQCMKKDRCAPRHC